MSIDILEIVELATPLLIDAVAPVTPVVTHSISHMYNRTVSIKRGTATVDSGGSPTPGLSYSTPSSSVKCRIQQFKGIEPVIAGRKFSKIKHVLYCDYDESILMSDLITYDSVDFEIVEQYFEGNNHTYQKLLLARSE